MLVLFSIKKIQVYLDSHHSLVFNFITINEKQDYKDVKSQCKQAKKKKKVGREWKECRKIICTGSEEQPSSEKLFVTREDGVCSHMHLNNPCAFRARRLS